MGSRGRRRSGVPNQHFSATPLPAQPGAGTRSPGARAAPLSSLAASSLPRHSRQPLARNAQTRARRCWGTGLQLAQRPAPPGSAAPSPSPGRCGPATWLAGLLHRRDLVARALRDDFHRVVGLLAGPTRRQLLGDDRVRIWAGREATDEKPRLSLNTGSSHPTKYPLSPSLPATLHPKRLSACRPPRCPRRSSCSTPMERFSSPV